MEVRTGSRPLRSAEKYAPISRKWLCIPTAASISW